MYDSLSVKSWIELWRDSQLIDEWNLRGCNNQHEYVEPVGVYIVRKRLVVQICHDQLTKINRSDYSFALEKLHPGTAGNDEALFNPNLPLQLREGNK